MASLPFNEQIVRQLADFRMQQGDSYTTFFNIITDFGSEMGYIFLISIIYWVFSKRKATRIAYAILLSSFLNSVLKDIIKNPRPFVESNETEQLWGTQAEGYSTPSGHAQISGTFWTTLALLYKNKWLTILSITMIILVGISRPILGVHYVEDVMIGWLVGILLAFLIYRIWGTIKMPESEKVFLALVTLTTFGATLITGIINGFSDATTSYVTIFGIFAGIALGERMEKRIKFNSKSSSILNALLRILLGIILVAIPLFAFDVVFEMIAADNTPLGYVLRWVRYLSVGLFGLYIAPLLYVNIGLSEQSE